MKVEETENLKLQYIENCQTTTSNITHVEDSDNELAEKSEKLKKKTKVLKENSELKMV